MRGLASLCSSFLVAGCYLSHGREALTEPADGGSAVCVDGPRDSCEGPDDPIYSREAPGSSNVLHWWTGGGCVPVSIDPIGEPARGEVMRALAAWGACSPFCTTILSEAYAPDAFDCPRRLHFAVLSDPVGAATTLSMQDGELLDAEINLATADTYPDLVGRIGTALGLGQPSGGPPVALVAGDSVLPDALNAACVLYGSDPLCD